MKIIYNTRFIREYKKLPSKIITKAQKIITTLEKNPFNPILKTHKLNGKLKNFYACNIDYSYRIIFEIENDKIKLLSTGDHDIYE